MKKILFIIIAICTMTSCTEQQLTRNIGGDITIEVPIGYKVTSATWKGTDLFYFLEPMDSLYIPQEKMFVENSTFGIIETKVIFKEKKLNYENKSNN